MPWYTGGNLGLLTAGASYVLYKRKVVQCLDKPPFPPRPECVGLKCPETIWNETWDQRCNGDDEYFYRNILLIPCGGYNTSGQKDEERTLSPLGIRQAEAVGHRLRSYNLKYNGIWSSSATRAKQTADIISKALKKLPVVVDTSLMEGAPLPPVPEVPGLRDDHVYYQDEVRMEAAFRKHIYRPEPDEKQQETFEIFVTHKNLIRYFVCRALQLPPQAWLRFELPHASITWLFLSGDGVVTCRVVGEASFLPMDHVTY